VDECKPLAHGAITLRQGLTIVHFSAQRKHIWWHMFRCMVFPQSIKQGEIGRCDQAGLG